MPVMVYGEYIQQPAVVGTKLVAAHLAQRQPTMAIQWIVLALWVMKRVKTPLDL